MLKTFLENRKVNQRNLARLREQRMRLEARSKLKEEIMGEKERIRQLKYKGLIGTSSGLRKTGGVFLEGMKNFSNQYQRTEMAHASGFGIGLSNQVKKKKR